MFYSVSAAVWENRFMTILWKILLLLLRLFFVTRPMISFRESVLGSFQGMIALKGSWADIIPFSTYLHSSLSSENHVFSASSATHRLTKEEQEMICMCSFCHLPRIQEPLCQCYFYLQKWWQRWDLLLTYSLNIQWCGIVRRWLSSRRTYWMAALMFVYVAS